MGQARIKLSPLGMTKRIMAQGIYWIPFFKGMTTEG